MGISRREFLQGTAAFSLAGYSMPDDFEVKSSFPHPLSIIQGPTNETVTQLAVDVPKWWRVRYELIDSLTGKELSAQLLGSGQRSFSFWRVDRVRFEGLELGRDYYFRVVDDHAGLVLDQRILRALDTNKKNARIAFMSCMVEVSPYRHQMWRAVKKANPDVIFLQGDNVYGDIFNRLHGPTILWWRYVITRRLVPYYHWDRLVPSIAVWDDHDFGHNDVNGDYKHKDHSYDAFISFYAQDEIPGFYHRGPGISSEAKMFGHQFIFVDGRYYRALPSSLPKGFLGDEQFQWIENIIENTRLPLWLAMGSEFFSGYDRSHSYERRGREEFDLFKKVLARAHRPILLSSGDLHYSEIMHLRREEFGFECYEMTSSSLHSLPDRYLPDNPRRIDATLKENFIFLDFHGDQSVYDLTCVGRKEKVRFRRQLSF